MTLSTSKYNELCTASEVAQTRLSDFARGVLIEGKYVPKSFDAALPIFPGNSSGSLHRLLQILLREFLKRNPSFKLLRSQSLNTRRLNFQLMMPSLVLARYITRIRNKARLAGADAILIPEIREDYAFIGVRTIPYLNLNVYKAGIGVVENGHNNPYKLFLYIEDILKVMETLSRYVKIETAISANPFFEKARTSVARTN